MATKKTSDTKKTTTKKKTTSKEVSTKEVKTRVKKTTGVEDKTIAITPLIKEEVKKEAIEPNPPVIEEPEKESFLRMDVLDLVIVILVTTIFASVVTGVVLNYEFKKEHIIYEIDNKDENLSKLISIYDDIVDNYYDEIDEEGMVNSAIEGMLGFLEDKYSIYLSGRDSELYGDSLEGTYSGIGILANYNVIEYVYDDTPAMKAGLKPGDEIIKVNGTEINKDNYADISNLLKANGEKENEIIVKRNNEEVTFKVKVDSVNVPVTAEDVITKDGHKIGYIRLSSFTKSSYKQFKKSLDNVKEEDIESLIIDLRGNSGGYVESAYDIAQLFIKKDSLVYTEVKKDSKKEFKDETASSEDFKIVILVNNNTASAAELLTIALKDNNGALVIGNKTFGKSKIQVVKESTGTLIKYTTAEWFGPKDESIDGVGITPDMEVNIEIKDKVIMDTQLDKAIEELSRNA